MTVAEHNITGIAEIKKRIMQAQALDKEPPEPLRRGARQQIEFPVDSLPPLLQSAVLAMHDKIQAPLAICAQTILATVNIAVQGHANIMMPFGQERPISCFFLTIAESGERKTTCDKEALKAIEEYEAQLRLKYELDMQNWQNDLVAWEKKREAILKDSNNYPNRHNLKEALDKVGEKPKAPLTPLVICSDPTFEGLCKLMLNGQPSLGIFSSEGGQFIGGHGMKEENKIRTSAALSNLWDGGDIKSIRASNEIIAIRNRRLCMHLMIQPHIGIKFLSDKALKDQGLLSRMLIVASSISAGNRLKVVVDPASTYALEQFHKTISNILSYKVSTKPNFPNELSPRIINLTDSTKEIFQNFYLYVEKQMANGGEFCHIRGFANKCPEHALRIAATLALFDNLSISEIEPRYLNIAINIVTYYINEALRLFDSDSIDSELLAAEKLLDWLHNKWEEEYISLPDIYQRSLNSINTKAKALKIIAILEWHNWLQRCDSEMLVKGRIRKDVWRVVKSV